MDIAILLGVGLLAALHLVFAWRAFTSRLRLSINRRYRWVITSLLLGPMGYYAMLGLWPSELFCEE
ncbi:hypothetical protein [Shewanella sp. YIC-542]|uniref:hypothetical protein n=1 Tax=Shewanella mytili TaxID=3377111 RepID=UPI00398F682E